MTRNCVVSVDGKVRVTYESIYIFQGFCGVSEGQLPVLVHAALIDNNLLYQVICHISQDSAVIKDGEKSRKKMWSSQERRRVGRTTDAIGAAKRHGIRGVVGHGFEQLLFVSVTKQSNFVAN